MILLQPDTWAMVLTKNRTAVREESATSFTDTQQDTYTLASMVKTGESGKWKSLNHFLDLDQEVLPIQ